MGSTSSSDPYERSVLRDNPYVTKRPLHGSLAVVLRGSLEDRGLRLIKPISRAIRAGEIHELVATTEETALPGEMVNRIAYLGFVEFANGGVLVAGDTIRIGGLATGVVAGFDETHAPNHLNIVVRLPGGKSGFELGLRVEDGVICEGPG